MKTKTLPPFYWRRKWPTALAKFVFTYEPETIAGSHRFRRELARVLNTTPPARWLPGKP